MNSSHRLIINLNRGSDSYCKILLASSAQCCELTLSELRMERTKIFEDLLSIIKIMPKNSSFGVVISTNGKCSKQRNPVSMSNYMDISLFDHSQMDEFIHRPKPIGDPIKK